MIIPTFSNKAEAEVLSSLPTVTELRIEVQASVGQT